ncbi:MAG: c-type cytochrome biogenesis protein CcmI [Pseudomonadota bacterium]
MADPMLIGLGLGLLVLTALSLLAAAKRMPAETGGREDAAIAIFADQLAEIDRDAARGLVSDAEAEGARTEIKRRMIAADRQRQVRPGETGRASGWTLGVLALVVPAAGLAVYLAISDPFARSGFAPPPDSGASDIADLAEQVRARLEASGEGPTEGWLLLARTYAGMGQTREAADAYARVADRDDITADGLARYAELLIVANGGTVSPQATTLLDRALALEPDPRATYYRAVAYEQAARPADALALVEARLAGDVSEEAQATLSAYRDTLRARLVRPTAPDAAAVEAADAMSEEDRAAFIRSMVDGLAARLDAEPADLDGWLRLANAYRVLGEAENAVGAYRSAEALLAGLGADDPRRQIVADGLAELSQSEAN